MIEITRNLNYTYRISPLDAKIIERKPNRSRARWQSWRMFDSQTEAKLSMLRMKSAEGDAATADGPEGAANV